jgi:hypothetical protein
MTRISKDPAAGYGTQRRILNVTQKGNIPYSEIEIPHTLPDTSKSRTLSSNPKDS